MKLTEQGFSLIELMVSMVVLSVGLLGLAALQGTAINGNQHGSTISQATALAQDVVEQIRYTDYDDINTTNFPALEPGVGGTQFDRAVLIEEDEPLNELKRITVTVSWHKQRLHQVVLRTIVSDED